LDQFVSVRKVRVSLWRRDWFWALLLIAFVFIAYTQVFRAGFIWDDESHLTQNPCVVGPLGLKEIWITTQAVYYPLVLTAFWALHKFFGLNPLPYHLLNILLHAASAILLWRVLQVLRVRGAWLGAALWALHPVMVQSVGWVTELKNTQSCVFYLLSILFFLKWEDQGGAVSRPPQRRIGDRRSLVFALSLLFFILATLSKPSVVMLPFVLALCIWWMRGKIRWRDMLALVPFALISALASAWTIWEQKFHAGAVGPDWEQTFPERLIIAGKAIWFYLGKVLWPHPLIFIYPRWDVDSSKVVAYLPLLAAIAGLVALWFIHAKWGRALFFAASYYVISLFPVLGFFSVYFFRYSFVSDHFQYLASMGPLASTGAGIATLLGRFCETPDHFVSHPDTVPRSGSTIASPRWRLVLSGGLCGIFLVSLGFLTWRQTAEYRDPFALYRATLQENPGCWMAHYNLGVVLSEQGEADQAIDHYRRAVDLRPDYAKAHYNLGRLLVEHGQLADAIAHCEKAAALNPADADAQNNLGVTLFGIGRADDAIAHYRKALEISPENVAALSNLAWLLATSSDPSLRNGSEAVRLAERADSATSRSDKHPAVLRILAAAYAEAGQFAEAKETAQRALEGANVQGNTTLAEALQGELALYDLRLPYHR
jgi:tetratricopeptide (TPR) repeat protein